MIRETKNQLAFPSGFSGQFKIDKYKTDNTGNVIESSKDNVIGWTKNLITNYGLNAIAASNWCNACFLGSGNSEPHELNTSLDATLGSNSVLLSHTHWANPIEPYQTTYTRVFRFNAGICTGNISEIGIGAGSNSLFSRMLIRDSEGNPTVITKLNDEVLDVTWTVSLFPQLMDFLTTLTITGNKGITTHDVTIRASGVGSTNIWTMYNMKPMKEISTNYSTIYSNDIRTITLAPTGTSSYMTPTADIYQNGSFEIVVNSLYGYDIGNFTTGIKSALIRVGPVAYQLSFTPTIMKTAFTFATSSKWGRY